MSDILNKNINIENLNIDELKVKIKEYENLANKYYNYEQAVKRILNSIYGAFGNEYFHFFNIDIAESITLQGQDIILYTEKILNEYFNEIWHEDIDVHNKMNIKVLNKIINPVVIYIDTDSCYLSFDEVIKKSTWNGNERDFILKLYDIKLKSYINNKLNEYASLYGVENFLSFDLQSIAKNAIWLAKKNYIQNISWVAPNIIYDNLTEIKITGFDNVKSSTPTFARKKLTEAIKIILKYDDFKISYIIPFLKEVKKEFQIAPIEDICFNVKISGYEKYIIDDKKEFKINLKCPYTCKAAGYYNYLLYNSNYKDKYPLIFNGEKIKIYKISDSLSDVFAFIPGYYPYEFAPAVDYNAQFERSILDPLNRIFNVLGLQSLNRNLLYINSLF